MGHFNSGNIKPSSDILLKAKVGREAIAVDDLVEIADQDQIWPVKNKNFAAIPNKEELVYNSAYTANDNNDPVIGMFDILYSKNNEFTYIARPAYNTDLRNVELSKFNSKGELVRKVTLTGSLAITGQIRLLELFNNDIAVIVMTSDTDSISSTILNSELNATVYALASLGSFDTAVYFDVVALAAGGFAIVVDISTAIKYLVVNGSNAGAFAIVSLPTTNTATGAKKRCKIAQLSNGNVIIAYHSTTEGTNVLYRIYSTAGASVVTETQLVNSTISANGTSDKLVISAMVGYCCIGLENSAALSANVLTNAGTLLNYMQFSLTLFGSTIPNNIYERSKIFNDGQNFWFVIGTNAKLIIGRLTTTGLNSENLLYSYDVNTFSATAKLFAGFNRGTLVVRTTTGFAVLFTDLDGKIKRIYSIERQSLETTECLTVASDGVVIVASEIDTDAVKYIDSAILGVAKTLVPINSSGTLSTFVIGSGNFVCNELPGLMTGFDQINSKLLPGTKGVLFSNSVLFE